ncbi:unnamed protein product [Closterium sp. NIES-65]|nr:unnamed protein product [Closterium sp. NIES-65]
MARCPSAARIISARHVMAGARCAGPSHTSSFRRRTAAATCILCLDELASVSGCSRHRHLALWPTRLQLLAAATAAAGDARLQLLMPSCFSSLPPAAPAAPGGLLQHLAGRSTVL